MLSLCYWNHSVEVVLFLDRRWSLSELPLLEPLLLESEWSHVTGVLLVEWSHVTGVLLVKWSRVTRVVVSKIKSRLLFLAIVASRRLWNRIIAEVSVFGLVSLRWC
ncbi:609_t:CDS:2, partial [Dentiscutata erythropus]